MRRYAENTAVPVERSRVEIEQLLKKHGATAFFAAFDDKTGSNMIGFRLEGKMFRIEVKSPRLEEAPRPPGPPDPKLYTRAVRGVSVEKMNERVQARHQAAWSKYDKEQAARAAKWTDMELRRRWRAQLLLIKAKLEVIAMGASTVDREFLADMLMADNKTVGQRVLPALAEAYRTGKAPTIPLLTGGSA